MLFQGEEFAASTPFLYFADHEDPEMAKLVSEGRKKEFAAFGWDEAQIPNPEDPRTFTSSRLNWDEIHEGHPRRDARMDCEASYASAATPSRSTTAIAATSRSRSTRKSAGCAWIATSSASSPIWASIRRSFASAKDID